MNRSRSCALGSSAATSTIAASSRGNKIVRQDPYLGRNVRCTDKKRYSDLFLAAQARNKSVEDSGAVRQYSTASVSAQFLQYPVITIEVDPAVSPTGSLSPRSRLTERSGGGAAGVVSAGAAGVVSSSASRAPGSTTISRSCTTRSGRVVVVKSPRSSASADHRGGDASPRSLSPGSLAALAQFNDRGEALQKSLNQKRVRVYRKDPFLGRDVRKTDMRSYVEVFAECREKNRQTLGLRESRRFLHKPVVSLSRATSAKTSRKPKPPAAVAVSSNTAGAPAATAHHQTAKMTLVQNLRLEQHLVNHLNANLNPVLVSRMQSAPAAAFRRGGGLNPSTWCRKAATPRFSHRSRNVANNGIAETLTNKAADETMTTQAPASVGAVDKTISTATNASSCVDFFGGAARVWRSSTMLSSAASGAEEHQLLQQSQLESGIVKASSISKGGTKPKTKTREHTTLLQMDSTDKIFTSPLVSKQPDDVVKVNDDDAQGQVGVEEKSSQSLQVGGGKQQRKRELATSSTPRTLEVVKLEDQDHQVDEVEEDDDDGWVVLDLCSEFDFEPVNDGAPGLESERLAMLCEDIDAGKTSRDGALNLRTTESGTRDRMSKQGSLVDDQRPADENIVYHTLVKATAGATPTALASTSSSAARHPSGLMKLKMKQIMKTSATSTGPAIEKKKVFAPRARRVVLSPARRHEKRNMQNVVKYLQGLPVPAFFPPTATARTTSGNDPLSATFTRLASPRSLSTSPRAAARPQQVIEVNVTPPSVLAEASADADALRLPVPATCSGEAHRFPGAVVVDADAAATATTQLSGTLTATAAPPAAALEEHTDITPHFGAATSFAGNCSVTMEAAAVDHAAAPLSVRQHFQSHTAQLLTQYGVMGAAGPSATNDISKSNLSVSCTKTSYYAPQYCVVTSGDVSKAVVVNHTSTTTPAGVRSAPATGSNGRTSPLKDHATRFRQILQYPTFGTQQEPRLGVVVPTSTVRTATDQHGAGAGATTQKTSSSSAATSNVRSASNGRANQAGTVKGSLLFNASGAARPIEIPPLVRTSLPSAAPASRPAAVTTPSILSGSVLSDRLRREPAAGTLVLPQTDVMNRGAGGGQVEDNYLDVTPCVRRSDNEDINAEPGTAVNKDQTAARTGCLDAVAPGVEVVNSMNILLPSTYANGTRFASPPGSPTHDKSAQTVSVPPPKHKLLPATASEIEYLRELNEEATVLIQHIVNREQSSKDRLLS
eukprot:CAMPEP_0178992118 /NCGR_PEP_ID=MMETSP0795-20121207/5923_1 /TAXON_ID=88552 /ORGANISM="Amoebophrya sp., Strain Ameob2" /LENGTH=1231 /DNA_ID=CAMNT_0020683937 /DNA_START=122 /DNA_END=3817 /DNA_ORIENTATION=+